MKHSLLMSLAVIPMLSLLSACGSSASTEAPAAASSEPHVHQWGPWTREIDEHVRKCKTCHKSEWGDHENGICEICADFRVLALGFLEGGDGAHCDFAKECNEYFPEAGRKEGFLYDFSTDFGLVTYENLAKYDVVMFLNNYPYGKEQRLAFEDYMEDGGGFIGFHVSAFTTESS